MKKKEILQAFIDVLNEAHDLDPKAIESLCNTSVLCKDDLGDHPDFVCGSNSGFSTIGTLGLLNGICQRLTGKKVVKIINEDCTFNGFDVYEEDEFFVTHDDDGWK